jgi:transcriptional regulator with XRE-family HTH domain
MDEWGERLQHALRIRRVNKLYALAVEIGVDESAISRWKQGRPISLRNAVELCRALDISMDWLVTGRGAPDAHRLHAPAADAVLAGLSEPEALRLRQALLGLAEAIDGRLAPGGA